MNVFAIADFHLSGAQEKPMDIFGKNWENHFSKICDSWYACVGSSDLVLIPGDISWAMKLEDALIDLRAIGDLPGKKVILRGNHDYWWSSVSKLRSHLPENMFAIQNDSLHFEQVNLCGTRGWVCPGSNHFEDSDDKIYRREILRMEMSIQQMQRNAQCQWADAINIAMVHYPPFNEKQQENEFTQLFEAHNIHTVVYGHLHGASCKNAFEGKLQSVEYHLVSCDHLDFKLKKICSVYSQ